MIKNLKPDIYPTIINFSDENEKLINNNSGISLLDYDKIPDDRTVEYIVGYKQEKPTNINGQQLKNRRWIFRHI